MIAFALLTMLGVACFAPTGLDQTPVLHRRTLTSMGLGAMLMGVNQDWWLLAFWLLLCANALRLPLPAMRLSRLDTAVGLYAVYAMSSHLMSPDAVTMLLMGVAGLGVAGMGLRLSGDSMFGQYQRNHAEALAVLSISASVGLSILISTWWLLGLLPLGIFFRLRQPHGGQDGTPRIGYVSNGAIWLWHLVLLSLILWMPWLGVSVSLLYVSGLAWWAYSLRLMRYGIDGGRVRIWAILLWSWWKAGWVVRLFGFGWQTWAAWADQFGQLEEKKGLQHVVFWLHPHNEYVHVLFEHGIVGLALLLGWIGSLVWHANQAGAIGQAVLFPAVAISSIAMTSFPWSLPTESTFGNMGLVVASLLVAIMLGGV